MTEKRFILTEQFSALQGVTFVKDECVDVDTYYTVDGAVDLLNELWEENEQLKQYRDAIMNWDSSKIIRVNMNTGEVDLVDKEILND